jgi:hypothetical protein
LTHTHQIIGYHPSPQLLAHNEYDELGQLIRKSVGGNDIDGQGSLQKVELYCDPFPVQLFEKLKIVF